MQKSIGRVAVGVVLILLIPFLGNLFVEGWSWDIEDFVAMGALLFVTGLVLEVAYAKIANPAYRTLACSAIVLALVAIWTELAVGAVSQVLALLF